MNNESANEGRRKAYVSLSWTPSASFLGEATRALQQAQLI